VSKTKKLLASVLLVGVTASLAAFGVFSAFSSQTSNPGNNFSAGTVNISDNDGNTAAYSLTGVKPGSTQSSCVRVVYTGSLDSDVHLYTPETIGSLGPYVNLTIQPGTQATPFASSSALQKSTSLPIAFAPCFLPNATEISGNA